MTPAKYDMAFKAGTTFRKRFTFKDQDERLLNFNGYTARMQLRESLDADDITVWLATSPEDPEVEGRLYGTLTLYADEGALEILIEDEVTSQITAGSYVYDIELVSGGGSVDSPLYGKIKVAGEVTR